jgi:hypothetical protein
MTATTAMWTVARRDAWGGIAAYRYRDTAYLVERGGDCDRYWVVQNEGTGEFVNCPMAGHAMPTRAWAATLIETLIEEEGH